MQFQNELIFLGNQQRESKKSGKQYYLAKFMNEKTQDVFEFYVPSDKLALVTELAKLKMLSKVCCYFTVSTFNNRAQIDLDQIEA